MDGPVLEEKSSLKMLGLTFSSKLNLGSISTVKTASTKIGALIPSMKFLSPEVALYLYKFTIWSCREHCCHIWASAPTYYLELLDKLQKSIVGNPSYKKDGGWVFKIFAKRGVSIKREGW